MKDVNNCLYEKVDEDGYGAIWKSECGHNLKYATPDEIGWAVAPLPTDGDRKYCAYCGGKILINED